MLAAGRLSSLGSLPAAALLFVGLLQPLLQLSGELVVAVLAHRLLVKLEKLGLLAHLAVTDGAGKMVNAPGLVEGAEHITIDDVVADKANVAKQLMVMNLAVSQSFLLVVTRSQERLLTLGTDKMLYMPSLAQSMNDPLFDGSPTRPADGDAHLVMATQAVNLLVLLSRLRVQLHTAGMAIEVVGMVGLSSKLDVAIYFNQVMALVADIFPSSSRLLLSIALTA